MADVLGKLRARLEADSKGFTAGIATAKKSLAGFGDYMKGSLDRIKGGLEGLGGAIAGIGFGAALKGALDDFTRIDQLAQRYGESSRNIQILGYMAQQAGLSLDELADSTKDLFNNLTANPDAFRRLGLSAEQLIGKDLPTQLGMMGDALKSLASDEERAALVMQTMGESGLKLLPLLTQGMGGLAEKTRELESMGGIFTEEQIERGVRANQELAKAAMKVKIIAAEIASSEAMGAVTGAANWAAGLFKEAQGGLAELGTYAGQAFAYLDRNRQENVGGRATQPYSPAELAEFRRIREASEATAANLTAPSW